VLRHLGNTESVKSIGVIGLGKMGILHSAIVNSLPNAHVKAICETENLLVKLAKSLLPKTIAFYKDHMKMVENEELDAVFITTPIDTHSSLVIDLARANKDLSLFLEKPLASSGDQAQRACDAARELRGIHMVGFQKRFSPVFQHAKQLLQNNSIGELMFFKASSFSSDVFNEGASWRFGRGKGGVLLDLAPHVLDIVLWLFGEPCSILGVKKPVYSSQVEDYAHAVMSFKTGVKGHVDVCWSVPGYRLPELSIEIYGRNGSITVTDDFVKLQANGTDSTASHAWYKQSFDTSVSYLLAEPEYTKEDETFLRHMSEHTLPESSFYEAAKVNLLIDRINASAENDRPC